MKYHKTKEGRKIKLKDLELDHLKNIIKWIDRKAEEGLLLQDGGGYDASDMWYEEETLYGEDARKELNYYSYISELNRRELDL